MTTATMETSNDLREGITVGLIVESPGKSATASPLPFGPDEPVDTGHEPVSPADAAATTMPAEIGRDGFLAGLKGRLVGFGDLVLGPHLSKQDRVNAELIRARDEWYRLI